MVEFVNKDKKCILVTRPQNDAAQLADRLCKMGYRTVIEPMFEIKQISDLQKTPHDLHAVLLTSANAVFALEKMKAPRNVEIFCVGDTTGKAVRKMGYENVICANDSSKSLIEMVDKRFAEKDSSKNGSSEHSSNIVYLCGDVLTVDLVFELAARGVEVEKRVVYESVERKNFSSKTVEMIRNDEIDAVAFYSKNTAAIFAKLAEKSKINKFTERLEAYCLSDAISKFCMEKLNFKSVEKITKLGL